MARRSALLVATYEYQDDGLRQLTAPAHDAEALAAVLRAPDIAGFEVTTLINEPHYRVGEAIADLYRDRRGDDLTLLYFTGHGLKDEDGRLYLATTNTRRGSLLFTALPAEHVDQAMSASASRRNVLVLDCCYSGAFPAGLVPKADTAVHTLERFQGRGRAVLTASDATQYSFEGNQRHGEAPQSVFTRHLVAGLRDGSADLDGDGDITIDELYSYVHDHVVDEMPRQRPKKQDNVEGRIVIARNVNWSLPSFLRHALSSPIAAERLAGLDGLANLYRIGNEMVRQQVAGELQRLTDDDSRAVSAAAAAHLSALLPRQAPGEAEPPSLVPAAESAQGHAPGAQPAQEQAMAAEPAQEHLPATEPAEEQAPAAGPEQEHEAFPGPAREQAPEPGPPPRQAAAPRAAAPGAATEPAAVPEPGGPARVADGAAALLAGLAALGPGIARWARAQLRRVTLAGVPGVLAIAAAGLLAAAVALRGPHDVSLPDYVAWYVIAMAALALASGTGMLLPRTRTLIGPGGLIGVAAASVWGLVLSSAPLFAGHTAPFISPRTDPALWCVVGGHVALAAAGCLAGLAVRRDRKVQVVLRRPGNLLTWVLTAVAAAGAILAALALAGELYQAARLDVYARLAGSADPAGPDLAAVVLAVAVPACAAVMRPAGFARWLLAGWVAGAGSVCLGIYAWARGGAEPGPEYAVVLGGALVLLAVAAAAMSRWGVTAPPSARPHRRSALAAGLSAVPLLAASGAVAAYLLAQGPVIQTQSLGAVVSPDGRHLYVTAALHTLSPDPEDPKGEPGRLLVVDTATGRTVGAPVAVGSEPVYLAYSRDGNHVYVANAGENSVSVVSTLENTTEGSPIPIGHPPGQLTASADGSRLLVVDSDHGLSVIDTRANVVSRRIALPGDAGAVVVSADGRRAYFSRGGKGDLSAIDTATGATTAGPVRLGYNPDSMAVSPDGSRLYVLRSGAGTAAGADALSAVDTATLKATGPSAPVEGDLHLGMTVSPDGRRVYVTNLYAGSVSVIDTQLHTSVGTPAPVGDGPREVTVSADGRHVYVTLLGANKVATFSSAAPGTVSLISLTS